MLAYRAFLDGVGTRATFTFPLKDPVEEGFTGVKSDASGWKELPQELISISEDRREITLTITDGGPGDADGLANGIIVDPFGPMEKAAIPQPDALLDETSCFIRSLFH